MKRTSKIILIISLSILGTLSGWLIGKSLIPSSQTDTYITCTISQPICQFMFECEPNEFNLENKTLPFDGVDFCEEYKVDNNNLILVMDPYQAERWEQYYCGPTLTEYREKTKGTELDFGNIVVSDDYNTVTVNAFDELSLGNAIRGKDAVKMCIIHKLVNKVEPDEIAIDYIVRDAGNGNVVFQAVCPPDSIDWIEWLEDVELSSNKEHLTESN